MNIAASRGIIRPRPTVFDVEHVAQRVEVTLPTRGRDVQGFPGLQVDPGSHDVDVDSAGWLVVPDRGPGIAFRIQSGPGQALKVVQHLVYLFRRWIVLRRPGNHAGSQPVFEVQGVGNLTYAIRIAAQYLNLFTRPAFVIFYVLEIVGGRPAGTAGLVVFNHHARAPRQVCAQCQSGALADPVDPVAGSGWRPAQSG